MSSRSVGLGSSWPNGHVSLQLVGEQATPVQAVQVEVASTAVMDAKLVVNVIGGESAPSCWAAAGQSSRAGSNRCQWSSSSLQMYKSMRKVGSAGKLHVNTWLRHSGTKLASTIATL